MLPAAFVFRDNLAALATTRELGRAGIEVVVLDAVPGPAASSRFSRFVEAPSYYDDPEGWARFVRTQAERCSAPPVVFPTEDAALLVADRFHDVLAPVVRYPYAAPGPAVAALDKRRLYAAAAEAGASVPKCIDVSDGFPSTDIDAGWIAKPACRYWFDATGRRVLTFLRLTGGSKAIEGDLRAAATMVRDAGFPTILQERVPGPFENLFSVGLALDKDGSLLASFCSRKHGEYPEPFGDGLIVESVPCDEDLVGHSADLLRKLGYWGICDLEYKLDDRDGRYKLLDANPRVWLWLELGALSGVPIALSAYALATGDRSVLALAPPRSRSRASWTSPRGSAAFLLKAWRPARHGWPFGARVATGALRTIARDLVLFRDPLYVKPRAWSTLLAAFTRSR
jgi:predicted ATP-grasp superfamily ATP-dependent carboligase